MRLPAICLAAGLSCLGIAGLASALLPQSSQTESRIRALENGLFEVERTVGALEGWGGDLLLDARTGLTNLVRVEPFLANALHDLLLLVTQPGTAFTPKDIHPAATMAQRAIREEVRHLREREELRKQALLLTGLAGVGMGGVTLLAGLVLARRQLRRESNSVALKAAELRAVCNATPIGLALLDQDCRLREVNPSFASLAGQEEEELQGRHITEALPLLGGLLLPLLRSAMTHGEKLPGQEIQVAGPGGRIQHYFIAAEPVPAKEAEARLSLVVMDISDRAAVESWRLDLVNELNHRVKNTLSTVQSLAAQTMRGAGQDPNRFAADFSARLGALSRSHELLASVGWSNATLDGAIEAALTPWKGIWMTTGQLIMHGPTGLVVRPAQAQAMVIAISELASNASRHGALAHDGRVTLRWQATPNGVITVAWHEHSDVRLSEPPIQRGFGLRFLERGLAHDLGTGAQVQLRFEPTGLQYDVMFRAGSTQPSNFRLERGAA